MSNSEAYTTDWWPMKADTYGSRKAPMLYVPPWRIANPRVLWCLRRETNQAVDSWMKFAVNPMTTSTSSPDVRTKSLKLVMRAAGRVTRRTSLEKIGKSDALTQPILFMP